MRTLKLKQKFQGNYLLTVERNKKKKKRKKKTNRQRATTNYGWGYAMAT